ncbi:hypothetical protein H6F78_00160 [Coleofasciculus sp. FACHB-64]|uniref:hypothetical protein n=1 Tax=Cyanophyceae TaxID=3028117 RepID=UPI001689952D|nr:MULTISPECIES: hypothetical protein [unclassified Coleofasciculus]MBD1840871.1 hypothetical protein [Coleofasciculus sp. FACHB-501]MBD2044060.1 hypothetical protein [Coleofasciculus sp. FACHB-64]
MPGHDIIVIGASAGGVEALIQLVADLPPNLRLRFSSSFTFQRGVRVFCRSF